MARLRSIVFAFMLICGVSAARADVTITVSYSEPADFYSMMDNVSGWLEGFVIPQYRAEWEQRFGWSAEDQEWADRYREYRQRTFIDETQSVDPLSSADGIFASRAENTAGGDPLATYFLAQPDLRTAMANLTSFASPQDARMLRGFYRHFEPGWRVLLRESGPLKGKAERLQARFDNATVEAFINRVSKFYGTSLEGEFTVYFTRHPPGNRTSAEPLAGSYILLHSPPVEEGDDRYWDAIVMHELVHYISSRQPEEQKRELTERFLKQCPIPDDAKRLWLVEEPLAVAWGQAAYSSIVLNNPLDPNDNWYGIPWVNTVSRTIAPSVLHAYATEATIDGPIINELADRCADLTTIVAQLGDEGR